MSATGVIRQLGAEQANFRMARHPTTIRGRHQNLHLGQKARELAALKAGRLVCSACLSIWAADARTGNSFPAERRLHDREMVLTFENVALQPRIRTGALPHKLFSAPLRKRRIAATTCSREVNGKSTWVPGMFTISTLDRSRRTRSMDTARNRTIYFCSPGEVGCSLGRLPAAYIHHGLGIDGKGRREEGFVPRGDGRLGGRRVAPPKFHDRSRTGQQIERAEPNPFSANRCSSSTILGSPTLQPLQLDSRNRKNACSDKSYLTY